jgi:fumarylacetoacetate (FAA) hydrolase
MKLATYQDGSRDGQLVVVSRDLTLAHYASGVATRLQQVLDDWNFLSPQLEELSQTLNHGKARHAFPFDPALCMAPLPRAYQWVMGAAFTNQVELLRKAAGTEGPPEPRTAPSLARRASDEFSGPRADIVAASVEHGIDFGAAIAVITGDVAQGTGPDAALEGIRLLMLANEVTLRHRVPGELATVFAPVAATPDELLHAWNGGRVQLNLESTWNGKRVGLCQAGEEMTFHFGQLIAHLCSTRGVRAGSIVGSGTVGNADASRGYACIAAKRALETLEDGAPKTEFMQFGDTIRIDMKGLDGLSVFGTIEQKVVPFA